MPSSETVSCPYHFDHVKILAELQTSDTEQNRSLEKLWDRMDESVTKTKGLEVQMVEVQKDAADAVNRLGLHNEEGEGYRHMTRQAVRDLENLQNRSEGFARKSDVDSSIRGVREFLSFKASKEDVKNLKFWIRIWGVGTVLAILALIVNLLFVIIPLAWPQAHPPAAEPQRREIKCAE